MPLFPFLCEACEATCEVLVRRDEGPRCPSCGSDRMIKGLSRFAPAGAAGAAGPDPAACDMGSMCCGGGCGFPQN